MERKIIKGIIILIVISFIFSMVISSYIDSTTPKVLKGLVDQMKKDKDLMNSIGGDFGTFEYHYNTIEFEETDSLHFEGTIDGNSKTLYFKGFAKKLKRSGKSNDYGWKIVRFQRTIK
ncbi:MAG: hypothetical protein ACOVQ4_02450 [Flectobacillus sp.]|uniref:hypothetical protein n=1 Tax=Flectobacillus sp. TaxID=50419 RepID=UPI003B9BEE4A